MIDIVSATRLNEREFNEQSALGLSLRRLGHDTRLKPVIVFENRLGLPEIYNARIAAADCADAIVFVHDDIWLDDFFFADHLLAGLRSYDVVGVAGNRRRAPGQPAWAFPGAVAGKLVWDSPANLSGAVGHGKQPFAPVAAYGPVPADCELLDGCFLAARTQALKQKLVSFDTRFDFHFYDMDFCRTARRQGLRLGTWPLCLTHQSGGGFGSPAWQRGYDAYIDKWGS